MITAAALAGWSTEAMPQGLPLPVIPEELTEPAERADYLLAHFWDGFRSRVIEEGELAEFLSVFPHATEEGKKLGAGKLVAIVDAQGEESVLRMEELIEGYLLDWRSPVRCDAAYLAFADAMMEAGWPGGETTAYLREMVMRTPVGAIAPDFRFISDDGEALSFRETAAGVRCVLLLHDPDCGECRELIGKMREDAALAALIAAGKLRVVAVRMPGEEENREGTIGGIPLTRHHLPGGSEVLPEGWTGGCATEGWISGCAVEDLGESLYAIPAFPALYLVSPEGRVELKDASWEEVASVMTRKQN